MIMYCLQTENWTNFLDCIHPTIWFGQKHRTRIETKRNRMMPCFNWCFPTLICFFIIHQREMLRLRKIHSWNFRYWRVSLTENSKIIMWAEIHTHSRNHTRLQIFSVARSKISVSIQTKNCKNKKKTGLRFPVLRVKSKKVLLIHTVLCQVSAKGKFSRQKTLGRRRTNIVLSRTGRNRSKKSSLTR